MAIRVLQSNLKLKFVLSKIRTAYFCKSCGSQHSKWEGRCNSCGEWNTLEEEIIQKETKSDVKSKSWKEPSKTENNLKG